jgi:hypothetical protein
MYHGNNVTATATYFDLEELTWMQEFALSALACYVH